MRFLLTNDDGYGAPGLETLERAAIARGSISVIAPDDHLSGCSHQIVDKRPIAVTHKGEGRFTLDAFPADCVRLANQGLVPEFDWVLSGVNNGGNLGVDLYLSGTVAAIREAAILGHRAIGFSQYRRNRHVEADWSWTERQVGRVLPVLLERGLDPGYFWNVNFPHPEGDIDPPLVFCDPDPQPLQLAYVSNGETYTYSGSYQKRPQTPGHDVEVCFGGAIAISLVSVFRAS